MMRYGGRTHFFTGVVVSAFINSLNTYLMAFNSTLMRV